MLEQRIQQNFIDSADLKYQVAQVLGKPVADAAQALLACVASGNKILACGNGASAALAQQFVTFCMDGFERERPAFAALALTVDGALLTGAGDGGDLFARQVRALGQAGDVLLLCTTGQEANLLAAVVAAHEREMVVVALTGRGAGPLTDALRETDLWIAVPHERPARVREVHALVLHGLCDGMDWQLFGGEQEVS